MIVDEIIARATGQCQCAWMACGVAGTMWLAMVGASMSSDGGVMHACPVIVRAYTVMIYACDDKRDNLIYTFNLVNCIITVIYVP